MSEETLWEASLQFFEETLPAQQFNSWIKPLVCETKGDLITLTAPNTFILKLFKTDFCQKLAGLQIHFYWIRLNSVKSWQNEVLPSTQRQQHLQNRRFLH